MKNPSEHDAARRRAHELATRHLEAGDPTGWFEELYSGAGFDAGQIPWADGQPHPLLASWLEENGPLSGVCTLVVGCGLGDDAVAVAGAGASVTAFDLSHTAVEWCRRRFPDAPVRWQCADLLSPPSAWHRRFSLVVEIYTLQSFPPAMLEEAFRSVARFVAPGGRLLVICRGRDASEPVKGPPWPLERASIETVLRDGFTPGPFDDVDVEGIRHFRSVWTRSGDDTPRSARRARE